MNTESENKCSPLLKLNCKLCYSFKNDEVGDSEYGSVYSETPSCSKYLDIDDDGNELSNFDREIERECCDLDFWAVIEVDAELKAELSKETFGYDKTYESFEKKYKKMIKSTQ